MEATRGEDPTVLGTLAAAYAEVGDFPSAIETQQLALSLYEGQDRDVWSERLEDYLASRPFREIPRRGSAEPSAIDMRAATTSPVILPFGCRWFSTTLQ